MGRYASIDDDIVFPGVIVNAKTSQNGKASTGMDFLRETSKSGSQSRQGEC